jgi:GT2 family glycosyltransferase
MDSTVPISVIIPTYDRGMAVLSVLDKIQECDPKPTEILVHIDLSDGILERELNRRFPNTIVLESPIRLGPGGGRHRCLLACNTPYAVSFDDDSYPVDTDFFSSVEQLFSKHSHVAVFEANVWHRHEPAKVRTKSLVPTPSYIGCGYAIRVAAYGQVRGHLPRHPVSYGMEEMDLSIQLFEAGWQILQAGNLRVFHDTELKHHQSSEITSGTIANVGLYAFLHYPFIGWGRGFLQLSNKVFYCIRMGRIGGICSGLFSIPGECYRNRQYRKPILWQTLKEFHHFKRTGVLSTIWAEKADNQRQQE